MTAPHHVRVDFILQFLDAFPRFDRETSVRAANKLLRCTASRARRIAEGPDTIGLAALRPCPYPPGTDAARRYEARMAGCRVAREQLFADSIAVVEGKIRRACAPFGIAVRFSSGVEVKLSVSSDCWVRIPS